MSMRISEHMVGAGLLCFALAACDGTGDESHRASAGSEGDHYGGVADCAIGPDANWGRSCRVEQDGDILKFRHADGGFRRFRIVRDGRGVVVADGAEPVAIDVVAMGQVELRVGADRYRLPATIAGAVKP